MRNLGTRLLLTACALICPTLALAQGGVPASPIQFSGPTGRPLSGATVTVCTSAGTGFPCTPLASIFTDAGLTISSANPVTTDGNGNLPVIFAAPGVYKLSVTGSGITSTLVTATVAGTGGGNVILNANNAFTGNNTFTNINNTCFADQQAGADMGIKIVACITSLPSTGGVVDARGFQGAQTWSTNIFSGVTKPVLLLIGPCTFSVNVAQSPATPNIRILGLGGPGGNGGGTGTGNTTLSVNFASGDVFTPTASGASFELGNMNVVAGVTRTSGYVVNPAPGANMGYIHDLHIQNQYGTFKLFSASATPLNNWRFRNITWNCGSAAVHTGEFLSLGSTDNTVTSSAHIFENFSSSGDVCIHDTAAIHVGSNTDSPAFTDWNFSISRNNTSTQPNWLFDNTLGGGIAPRLVSLVNIYTEGDGLAGNDVLKIAACTDCTFTNGDFGGGDHGINITGGSGLKFAGGQVNNNSNGGLYVTSAVTNLGLDVSAVDFYGNSITTNNTFDDIQIADGTTLFSMTGNNFNNITSTVTANAPRYNINVLGTTAAQYYIRGNKTNLAKLGTGFIRDVTAGTNKYIETDQGRTVFQQGTGSFRTWYCSDSTHIGFQLGVQENISNGFEITPSTGNCSGALTFSTPQFSVLAAGAQARGLSPFAAGASDLGATALPWGNLWLGTAATNNLKFQPSAMAAARVLTIPDPLGNVTMPYVVASGTTTLTANAALAAVTSQAANTTAATGTLTTDSIEWSFATAPTAGDNLCHVLAYVTAGNVNFVRTNPTAAAQNVSALVINWRIIR